MSGLEGRDWSLLEATQESLREHMALAKQLQQRVETLEETLHQIKITEDSYDDEQTVLGGIYLKCEAALNT